MKSDMEGQQLCNALQQAVLSLLKQREASQSWEVDGIICVSLPSINEQHFVKINEKSLLSEAGNPHQCYACEKSKEVDYNSTNSKPSHEVEPSYRNVSVIDLEHGLVDSNRKRAFQHESDTSSGHHTEKKFIRTSSRGSHLVASQEDQITGQTIARNSTETLHQQPSPSVEQEQEFRIVKAEPDDNDFDIMFQESDSMDNKSAGENSGYLPTNDYSYDADDIEYENNDQSDQWPYRPAVTKNQTSHALGSEHSPSVSIEGDSMRMNISDQSHTNIIRTQTRQNLHSAARRKTFSPRVGHRNINTKQSPGASTSKPIGKPSYIHTLSTSCSSQSSHNQGQTTTASSASNAHNPQGHAEGQGQTNHEIKWCDDWDKQEHNITTTPSPQLVENLSVEPNSEAESVIALLGSNVDGNVSQLLSASSNNSALSSTNNEWPCYKCGQPFSSRGNRNRHIQTTCGFTTKQYKCNFCSAIYTRSDSKKRHMIKTHGFAGVYRS